MECCVKWSCVYTYIHILHGLLYVYYSHMGAYSKHPLVNKAPIIIIIFFSFYSIKITTIIIIVVVTIKT